MGSITPFPVSSGGAANSTHTAEQTGVNIANSAAAALPAVDGAAAAVLPEAAPTPAAAATAAAAAQTPAAGQTPSSGQGNVASDAGPVASHQGSAAMAASQPQPRYQHAGLASAVQPRQGDVYDQLLAMYDGQARGESAEGTQRADSASAQPSGLRQLRTISGVDSTKLRKARAMDAAEKGAAEKEARRSSKRRSRHAFVRDADGDPGCATALTPQEEGLTRVERNGEACEQAAAAVSSATLPLPAAGCMAVPQSIMDTGPAAAPAAPQPAAAKEVVMIDCSSDDDESYVRDCSPLISGGTDTL